MNPLGRETVPYNPSKPAFDPLPANMYPVKIESVVLKEIPTKLGTATVYNCMCRISDGEFKGRTLFGDIFLYKGGQEVPNWANRGYFTLLQALELVENDKDAEGNLTLIVIEPAELEGKPIFVINEHRRYWPSDIPEAERTEENKVTRDQIAKWIPISVGHEAQPDAKFDVETTTEFPPSDERPADPLAEGSGLGDAEDPIFSDGT